MKSLKNIVIVGGGTAGWLAALFVQNKIRDSFVTLIESSEIGILGAGEGTTPHFVTFLNDLGITPTKVIKEASGTVKNGIMFTDWNGDGKQFFHPFYDDGQLLNNSFQVGKRIVQGKNLDNLVPSSFVSKQYKAKIIYDEEIKSFRTLPDNSIALHFDARQLAIMLKNIGIARGIKVIDSKVKNIVSTGENIDKIILESGEEIASDLVFDCTGFKRLIIGHHFQSEWISYKKSIPNNAAIPFFLPLEGDKIPAYTEAIAMKYGWVWKIPVQGRYGCGYVFDSSIITEEDVKKEIVEKFGETSFPTVFKFEAGCYKDTWRGNCIALGLSSGFIEPLEATSIWTITTALLQFVINLPGALSENNSQAYRDNFNNYMYNFNEQILSFIYLHYCTARKDTVYWSKFAENNLPPKLFVDNATPLRHNLIPIFTRDIFGHAFNQDSLLTVGAGVKFFNNDAGKDLIEKCKFLGLDKQRRLDYVTSLSKLYYYTFSCVDHAEFLKQSVKTDE